jgi:hypothetical protein
LESEQFKNLVDGSPNGVLLVGQDGVVVSANQAATRSRSAQPLAGPGYDLAIGRLRALAQLGGILAGARTGDDACREVAEYASLLFEVSACLVLRLDYSADAFHLVAASGGGDADWPSLFLREDVTPLGLDGPVPVVIDDLQVVLPDFFNALRRGGHESAISMGLITDSGCHGMLLLLRDESSPLNEDDLVALRLFGSLAAASLRSAEQHETEVLIAETVQRALLAIPGQIAGVEHAVLYHSATRGAAIGGDFYDLFGLPDGRIGLLIGDVSGKGVDACLLTSVLKNAVKAYSYTHDSPATVLGLCNLLACDVMPERLFATAFFALYDP